MSNFEHQTAEVHVNEMRKWLASMQNSRYKEYAKILSTYFDYLAEELPMSNRPELWKPAKAILFTRTTLYLFNQNTSKGIEEFEREINELFTNIIQPEDPASSTVRLEVEMESWLSQDLKRYIEFASMEAVGSHAYEHSSNRRDDRIVRDLAIKSDLKKLPLRSLIKPKVLEEVLQVLFSSPSVLRQMGNGERAEYDLPISEMKVGDLCYQDDAGNCWRYRNVEFDSVKVILARKGKSVIIETVFPEFKNTKTIAEMVARAEQQGITPELIYDARDDEKYETIQVSA